MSKHFHQSVTNLRISSDAVFATWMIATPGILEQFYFKTDVPNTTGDVDFDVLKNGVSIYTVLSPPTLVNNTDEVEQTGIDAGVVKGDLITVKPTAAVPGFGFIGPNSYTQITVNDGLPAEFGGTSPTSFAIAVGSKVFLTQAGLAYSVGSRIRAASSADPTVDWMEGVVTAYTGTTFTVLMDLVSGAGSHSDWLFSIAGDRGSAGAAGSQGPTGIVESIVSGANVTVDNTDPANPIVAATGGGGGGATSGADGVPASPNAEDDEFDDTTLDAKWTEVTGGTAPTINIDTHIRSAYYAQFGAADGIVSLHQPFVPGAADCSITGKFSIAPVANFQGCAIYFYDTAMTTGIRIAMLFPINGPYWHEYPSFTELGRDNSTGYLSPIYLHLQRVGGTFTAYYSRNGISWIQLPSSSSQVFTISKIRLELFQSGAVVKQQTAIEWIRRDWLFI